MSEKIKSEKVEKPKKKRGNKVWFWDAECKYEVIKNRVKTIGWKLVDDEKYESKCNLFWIDVATIHERFRSIQPWQLINHFPGMPNIARKNRMGQNLNKMAKMYPVSIMRLLLYLLNFFSLTFYRKNTHSFPARGFSLVRCLTFDNNLIILEMHLEIKFLLSNLILAVRDAGFS